MNRQTAQKFWGHQGGFLKGVQTACPGVLEHLDDLVQKLIGSATNPFHTRVKSVVGRIGNTYYLEYAADDDPLVELVLDIIGNEAARGLLEKHFSIQVGQDIWFANLCGGGCLASLGRLRHRDQVRVQLAAVFTDENGHEIRP